MTSTVKYPLAFVVVSCSSMLFIFNRVLVGGFFVGEYDVEAMFTFSAVGARIVCWLRDSLRAGCSAEPLLSFLALLLEIGISLFVGFVLEIVRTSGLAGQVAAVVLGLYRNYFDCPEIHNFGYKS